LVNEADLDLRKVSRKLNHKLGKINNIMRDFRLSKHDMDRHRLAQLQRLTSCTKKRKSQVSRNDVKTINNSD